MAQARPKDAQKGSRQVRRTVVSRTARPAGPTSAISPSEALVVEEMALFYEQAGLPRMAGRIIGWLMICEPSHQSLVELGEVLQASKGSISTMTRLLIQLGIIQRVSIPGDRRDYVAIPPGSSTRMLAQNTGKIAAVRQIAARGLTALKGARPERLERLRELHDLYAFLEREMPLLLARWEKESKRGKQSERG